MEHDARVLGPLTVRSAHLRQERRVDHWRLRRRPWM